MKLYAVRDRKAGVFHKPFVERDNVSAIRGFEVACSQAESQMCKWPGDFELQFLADMDEVTGKFSAPKESVVLADPLQFVKVAQ